MVNDYPRLAPRKAPSGTERAEIADLVRRCPVVYLLGQEVALAPLVHELLATADQSRSRATLRALLVRHHAARTG